MSEIETIMIKAVSQQKFDEVIKIKINNVLDGFNQYRNMTLSGNESASFEENEKNFIKYLEECYKINKNSLIVDFYIKDINEEEVNKLKMLLEEKDRITLEKILKIKGIKTQYFFIIDINLIPFFVKLSTREIFFVTYYFINKPVTIWGNYNMRFPVFYNDEKIISDYLDLKNNYNLNIQ